MESYFPAGGFQLPFQRRLSRLYNDTKKSSDFVKDPVHVSDDPEIKALHRKLRIQKDRLVSWGLEWSDPSQSQSAEVLIDTSLSKAGLSEVVGSIMSTIKDILAEAEPLWQSSKRLIGERESEKSSGSERKMAALPVVPWDKGRFEDLVRDLTTSIDTLYDLSRTRSSAALSQAALYKSSGSSEDMRAFESTRMQTPRVIDPTSLTNLRSMQAEPMYSERPAEETRLREIVFMTKQAYSEMAQQQGTATGRQPYAPLLLEYANFDPIYSTTGIMPSMTRFEKLSAGLQTEPQRSPGSWTGLPRLLGYFEDVEHSRFGLVYQFPPTFNPVSFEHLTQNPLYSLCSLSDLLKRPDFEPKLEAKFRLASNLANTVFDMHARGITHGNLIDTNISFCNAVGNDPAMNTADVDIRRPLVSSFDLFPDSPFQDIPSASFSLYRHPLDPRVTSQSTAASVASNADPRVFDLYSLSMLLLSIGLWTNLELLVPHAASTEIPLAVLDQLAIRCGTLYSKAVQACWTAVEKELTGQGGGEQLLSRVQVKSSRYLEACCILDGVSGLEERLSDDLGEPRPAPAPVPVSPIAGPSKESKKSAKSAELYSIPEQRSSVTGFTGTTPVYIENHPLPEEKGPQTAKPEQPEPRSKEVTKKKTRLYPHVPLPAEVVEQWNSFLMPQINRALQHFYRKNPESVEISLESIGESARETRPTVLVVCTSVAKVRSILKKQLGSLFDGTTAGGFALKVCRGQVLRSRNHKSTDLAAANGEFQERPLNGASIGAWIGDRHLPPVSFGGLVLVDDKAYGMTVHHMLDDPDSATATEEQVRQARETALRSGAGSAHQQQEIADLGASLASWYADLQAESASSTGESSSEDDFACEFSDTESEAYSESAITSDDDDDSASDGSGGDDQFGEPGDIPGVEQGCGDGYLITQPALDDVDEGFYPSLETADEDHLDTFGVGEMYASSGIRRRSDENGLVHEIDWALFEFKAERQPGRNSIPRVDGGGGNDDPGGGGGSGDEASGLKKVLRPTEVAPASALPGLDVQCLARTSGLQSGRILQTITSVKIFGRQSPSHSYQVSGTPGLQPHQRRQQKQAQGGGELAPRPLGIPGDSGAWVVEREHGRLCGHVLAWSERKRVAYICPMDVLLLDIAETLAAADVRLPGGEAIVKIMSPVVSKSQPLMGLSAGPTASAPTPATPGAHVGDTEEYDDYDEVSSMGSGDFPAASMGAAMVGLGVPELVQARGPPRHEYLPQYQQHHRVAPPPPPPQLQHPTPPSTATSPQTSHHHRTLPPPSYQHASLQFRDSGVEEAPLDEKEELGRIEGLSGRFESMQFGEERRHSPPTRAVVGAGRGGAGAGGGGGRNT